MNPVRPTVSDAALSAIVANHDRLREWNDHNAQALQHAESRVQAIANIQATATLVAEHPGALSSQNFERLRALHLFDQTLSAADLARGFMEGGRDALLQRIQAALAFSQPTDMRLVHAEARTQAVLETPQALAQAARQLLQDPARLVHAASAQLDHAQQALKDQIRSNEPSLGIGKMAGAAVIAPLLDTLNPASKAQKIAARVEGETPSPIDWTAYAHLLGQGHVPPKPKALRDFSGQMEYEPPLLIGGQAAVVYRPSATHRLIASIFPGDRTSQHDGLFPKNSLSFLIQTVDDRQKYGHGTEVFLSGVKKLHEQGIDIHQIQGDWSSGPLGTNYRQFMEAHQQGATVAQAAKQTFTGRMAEKLGLTEVDTSRIQWSDQTEFNTLYPRFTRPDWGSSDPAWNDYANAWVLAQGRPGLTVSVKPVHVEAHARPAAAIPVEMLRAIGQLPAEQRDIVLRRMHENFAQQAGSAADHDHNPGPER